MIETSWHDRGTVLRLRVARPLLALAMVSAVCPSRSGAQVRDTPDSLVLPGVTLQYRTQGRGVAVVLLSGGPGEASAYLEPVYHEVARNARAVLLDQRGTGRSVLVRPDSTTLTLRLVVEDIEALRRQLGVDKLVLLGHSWGGELALAYAVAHPTHLRALVLVGSASAWPELGNAIGATLRARLTALDVDSIRYWSGREVDPRARTEALRSLRRLNGYAYFYDRRRAPERLRYASDPLLGARIARLMFADLRRTGLDLRAGLWTIGHDPESHVDVGIFYGDVDPIGAASAPPLRDAFPEATVRVFERCGHYPWIEARESFFSELADFLRRLDRT
jgi:proline iminopeptidase